MDFADVCSYFDDDQVYDGYTEAPLFFCHTTPHDDSTSSGATSRRRTMTTVDATTAPARRVIKLYEDRWLVSNSHPDAFQGTNVRRSYSIKRSTGLMAALTPGQACLADAGTSLYAHREYFRDTVETRTESEWDVMWNIFYAPGEPVVKGSFFREGSTLYRARNNYATIEELMVAEADQLDGDALQAAVFTSLGDVDLVTDARPTVATATTVIQTDVQKFYEFRTQAESDNQPGDKTVFVAASIVTPTVGGTFTMMGASWRIESVVPELDAWALRARRA